MRALGRPQDRLRAPRAASRSGAHAEVGAAVRKLLEAGRQGRRARPARQRRRPAQRGRRRSSSVFLPDGHDRHDARAARGPSSVYDATGDAIVADDPGRRARRRRHAPRRRRSSPARCRTASARRSSARARSARASSRRSSGSPTAARSTSPSASTSRPAGATSAAAGVARAPGITPDVQAADDPKTQDATRRSTGADGASQRAECAVRATPRAGAVVGVLEQRGRFLVGEPFFERGRRVDRRRARATRAPGDLVLVRADGRSGGRGKIARGSGARTSRATCSRR